MPHLENHILRPELKSDNTLHVFGVVSNPARYNSRYRLAREWIKQMEATPNVRLYVVEAAFGDRQHEVVLEQSETRLQLKTKSEVWIKENMINVGVKRLLPRDAKYIAWVDMDVLFRDPNWAQETIHRLQHVAVCQPWQQCADLGFLGNILQTHNSVGYQHQTGIPQMALGSWRARKARFAGRDPYVTGHTGYAWACTRGFWEQTHGLMDFCILGSGDNHMAWGMLGDAASTIHGDMHPNFFKKAIEWQDRAVRLTHKHLGYVPGRIEHAFHGPKGRRYYKERWKILVEHKFDPEQDLMYDDQGIIHLVGKPDLEWAISRYNHSRAEDSIEDH